MRKIVKYVMDSALLWNHGFCVKPFNFCRFLIKIAAGISNWLKKHFSAPKLWKKGHEKGSKKGIKLQDFSKIVEFNDFWCPVEQEQQKKYFSG